MDACGSLGVVGFAIVRAYYEPYSEVSVCVLGR